MSSIRSAANNRSIAARRAVSGPVPGRLARRRRASRRPASLPHSASRRSGKPARRHPVGGDARPRRHPRHQPLAGERAIGAELARHARQKPGGADVGKKADADFRHGESEIVARDAVRAMHRNADAAAHDDAVDRAPHRACGRLDPGVESVFLAQERQRLVVPPRAAEIVERADIAAGGEGAPAARGDDDPRDRGIVLPSASCSPSARTMPCVTALSACGRLSVTMPATPRRSNRMSALRSSAHERRREDAHAAPTDRPASRRRRMRCEPRASGPSARSPARVSRRRHPRASPQGPG